MNPIVIEGKLYLKNWLVGFHGKKNGSPFSLTACLPEGANLHGKKVRMTIEDMDEGAT